MSNFATDFEKDFIKNGYVVRNAPEHPLVQRLKDYYLGLDKKVPFCTEQKSVYSLSRPGQTIHVDYFDFATFVHPDVQFIHSNNPEWGCQWSGISTQYSGPQICKLPYQSIDGCYAFLNRWHKTDDKKTQQLLDRYIEEGYGLEGKQKVIFVMNEDQETYTLMGLGTLNEQEYEQTGVINWLFPPFLAPCRFD